jgi:hypothetical protein
MGLLAWAGRPRWVEWAALVLALIVVGRYLTDLHPTYFRTWLYDADSRAVFSKIEETAGYRSGPPVLLTCDWYYCPATNYYYLARKVQWQMIFLPNTPQGPQPFHFFLLRPGLDPLPAQTGFVPILTGRLAGAVLYDNPAALRQRTPNP